MQTSVVLAWIVWLCLGAVVYSYVLYPVLLVILGALVQGFRDVAHVVRKRDRRSRKGGGLPQVAVVISAFNEERHLQQRIDNLLALVGEDAEALGCTAEVQHARTILERGTSAAQQMAVYRQARDDGATRIEALRHVMDWLAQTTTL